jgi:hypothetical protein
MYTALQHRNDIKMHFIQPLHHVLLLITADRLRNEKWAIDLTTADQAKQCLPTYNVHLSLLALYSIPVFLYVILLLKIELRSN